MNAEEKRLQESHERKVHWKPWGPYLSERQRGTVRKDYSPNGTAWEILIDMTIPDRLMNILFVVTASVLFLGVLLVAFGTVTKSVGHQSGACELPGLRFSDAASAATEILEASTLGWRHLCEVCLRNGQMGSADYANTLVVERPLIQKSSPSHQQNDSACTHLR